MRRGGGDSVYLFKLLTVSDYGHVDAIRTAIMSKKNTSVNNSRHKYTEFTAIHSALHSHSTPTATTTSSAEGRYTSRSVIVDRLSARHKGRRKNWLTRARTSNKHMAPPVNTLTLFSTLVWTPIRPFSLAPSLYPLAQHLLTDFLVFILSCSLTHSHPFYSIDN